MEKTIEYSNDEITVYWRPKLCYHSEKCVKGLPLVFRPKERPWIDVNAAEAAELAEQIKKCPSGALDFKLKKQENMKEETSNEQISAEIVENGPLLVGGTLLLKYPDGKEETKKRTTAFCRCGASANKPFCDGSHNESGFIG